LIVSVVLRPALQSDCKTSAGFRATVSEEVDPITIFHEPINIRAENVERIRDYAESVGACIRSDVFEIRQAWESYALESLKVVHDVASHLGLKNRLHLWPDRSLGSTAVVERMSRRAEYSRWLNRCWNRVSEWPKAA